MDEHLSKPVDIAVLERAVRKYLVIPPPPETGDPQPRITPVAPYPKQPKKQPRFTR